VVPSIDAKEVSEVKSVNFLDNLSVRLAGVAFTTGGATGVGSTQKLPFRGEASVFKLSNPLFVVDGVPINNNSV